MYVNHQRIALYPRARLILAGAVGLLFALFTVIWICLPSLKLFAQYSQYSPLVRAAIIVKLLSPLLSFGLAGGWTWVLFLLYEWLLSYQSKRESMSRGMHLQKLVLHGRWSHDKYKQLVNPKDRATNHVSEESPERKRPVAAPALFQLDPTASWQYTQLPVMPLPMTNLAWPPDANQREHIDKKGPGGGEVTPYIPGVTQAEQIMQSNGVDVPEQRELSKASTPVGESSGNNSLQKPKEKSEEQKPVKITLLKQVRTWVYADDGTTLEIKLRGGENAVRLIQLAYIAWRRGAFVDKDKMLTYVLSRGKRRDMNAEQLGEVFDAAKRYLRRDLDRAVNQLKKSGHPISREEIDFFGCEPGFYWLHPSCSVVDLEKIEEYYQTIQIARKEGLLDEKLDGSIPGWVVEACQNLVDAYPGDFLQTLLEKYPEEFGVWVKEPVTFYRDRYLDALLILANYESAQGRNFHDNALSEVQNEEQRRYHIGRAAQLFYDYAMYAINSRWDQKVKFAYRAGKDGERVIRAARAIRRCVVEWGKLSNPDMIDQVYLAFKERMAVLSEGTWKPDKDTESDVAEAKAKTTSAYRFVSQIPASLHQDRKEGSYK
jgi:hypothetical protein